MLNLAEWAAHLPKELDSTRPCAQRSLSKKASFALSCPVPILLGFFATVHPSTLKDVSDLKLALSVVSMPNAQVVRTSFQLLLATPLHCKPHNPTRLVILPTPFVLTLLPLDRLPFTLVLARIPNSITCSYTTLYDNEVIAGRTTFQCPRLIGYAMTFPKSFARPSMLIQRPSFPSSGPPIFCSDFGSNPG